MYLHSGHFFPQCVWTAFAYWMLISNLSVACNCKPKVSARSQVNDTQAALAVPQTQEADPVKKSLHLELLALYEIWHSPIVRLQSLLLFGASELHCDFHCSHQKRRDVKSIQLVAQADKVREQKEIQALQSDKWCWCELVLWDYAVRTFIDFKSNTSSWPGVEGLHAKFIHTFPVIRRVTCPSFGGWHLLSIHQEFGLKNLSRVWPGHRRAHVGLKVKLKMSGMAAVMAEGLSI